MDTLIAERATGTRVILGSNHSIISQVWREVWPGKKPTWRLTFGICNGIAGGSIEYRTRREAMAEFKR